MKKRKCPICGGERFLKTEDYLECEVCKRKIQIKPFKQNINFWSTRQGKYYV